MKTFTRKGILNKLILILVILMMFNAVIPSNVSYAADPGGILLKPIVDLMMAFGDFIMDITNKIIYGVDISLIKVDLDSWFWEAFWIFVAVVVTVALIVAAGYAIIHFGPMLLQAIATACSLGQLTVSATAVIAAVGVVAFTSARGAVTAGMYVRTTFFSNEAVFPMFKVTPEEIFRGEVQLLNPNFFNEVEIDNENIDKDAAFINRKVIDEGIKTYNSNFDDANKEIDALLGKYGYNGDVTFHCEILSIDISKRDIWTYDNKTYQVTLIGNVEYEDIVDATGLVTRKPNGYRYTFTIESGDLQGYQSIGQELKPTVAKWYYALRNFALVVMMVILLYIGIRIMLCSISSEKAKYKNMLVDWVVAICLILVMHYIMVFAMNIVEAINKIFENINSENSYVIVYEYDQKIVDGLLDAGVSRDEIVFKDENGNENIFWNAKNLLGLIRVQAAITNVEETGSYNYFGYVIAYLVLVFYTIFFLYTYLRRILYLAFFTIISPLVAMTYPLDKLHDGKAQAFDMWLKEYIFNLMIQPVHLLLYTVFISSAFALASQNILYTLVAIGFMMPAEKFVRKMFGFDKAQTPGFLEGAAGTALLLTGLNKLLGGGNKGGRAKGGAKGKNGLQKSAKSESEDKAEQSIDLSDNQNLLDASNNADIPNPFARPDDSQRTLNNLSDADKKKRVKSAKKWDRLNDRNKGLYKFMHGNKTTEELLAERGGVEKSYWNGAKNLGKAWARNKLEEGSNYLASGKLVEDVVNFNHGIIRAGATIPASLVYTTMKGDIGEGAKTAVGLMGLGYSSAQHLSEYEEDSAMREEFERGLYGDNYNEAMLEKRVQEIIKDESKMRKIRDYLGSGYGINSIADAQKCVKDYSYFIKGGWTDMENFCTLVKLEKNQSSRDPALRDKSMNATTAATYAKFYKKAGGKPKNMSRDSDQFKAIYRQLEKAIKKEGEKISGVPFSDGELSDKVEKALANIDKYGEVMDSLTELPKDAL